MKIVTIVGARPQFVKAAVVSSVLRKSCEEVLVHTGQHYDQNMSEVFFKQMCIPEPNYNLGVGSGHHGQQTAKMLAKIEEILLQEKPEFLLVYGDTNSTLAGALAACKLHIPVAHVEAGLRSFNRSMPEEHNRVLTDHCSNLLFCPTNLALRNLHQEGIVNQVYNVGDVMHDAVLKYSQQAEQESTILNELQLQAKSYYLATIHRPYNTDCHATLLEILEAFCSLDLPVILPLHPRTRSKLQTDNTLSIYSNHKNLRLLEPVSYFDMLMLEKNASCIITDSGGIQKEAYFFAVPCLTLRPETEWQETIDSGWNTLVSSPYRQMLSVLNSLKPGTEPRLAYGEGNAVGKIVELLLQLGSKN